MAFETAADALLDQLFERRQALRTELEGVETAIVAVSRLRSATNGSAAVAAVQTLDLSQMTYADAAEAVLKRAGRHPMTTRMLMRRMELGGRSVNGKNAYRVLYRTLMKNVRFKNVGGRWALDEWYGDDLVLPVREDIQTQ